MEVNDFNVGEEFLVRVRVADVDSTSVGFETIGQHGEVLLEESFRLMEDELDAVVKVDAPKYDPFRKLKDGDKARVVPRDGRVPVCFPENRVRVGDLVTVVEDEDDSGFVLVRLASGYNMRMAFFFLELVTPVEEVMPYKVVHTRGFYSVEDKKLDIVASYSCKLHPDAKAAAEAECRRLNEEWQAKACRSEEGKEENNG